MFAFIIHTTFALCLAISSIILIFVIEHVPSMHNHCQTLDGCVINYNRSTDFYEKSHVEALCRRLNGSNCVGSFRCCYICSRKKQVNIIPGTGLSLIFYDNVESTFHTAFALYILSWISCFSVVYFNIYYNKDQRLFPTHVNGGDNDKSKNHQRVIFANGNGIYILLLKTISLIGFILFVVAVIMITITVVKYLRSFDCLGYIVLSIGWLVSFLLYLYFILDSFCLENKNFKGFAFCSWVTSCTTCLIQKVFCWAIFILIICVGIFALCKKFLN